MTIWTQELATACKNVASDPGTLPHRESLLADVKSRAREFAQQRVGLPMTDQQAEYFQCLRSRLDRDLSSHVMLNEAWSAAYEAETAA
jgi:hypothetical protein